MGILAEIYVSVCYNFKLISLIFPLLHKDLSNLKMHKLHLIFFCIFHDRRKVRK